MAAAERLTALWLLLGVVGCYWRPAVGQEEDVGMLQAVARRYIKLPACVYINLAKRVDREQRLQSELDMAGITTCRRQEAADASLLSVSGREACRRSHLAALGAIQASGAPWGLVLEDDVEWLTAERRTMVAAARAAKAAAAAADKAQGDKAHDAHELWATKLREARLREALGDDHELRATKRDDHELRVTKRDDHKLRATKRDDHKLRATKRDDHELRATKRDDHELRVTKRDDHELRATKLDDHELRATKRDDHELRATKRDDHELRATNLTMALRALSDELRAASTKLSATTKRHQHRATKLTMEQHTVAKMGDLEDVNRTKLDAVTAEQIANFFSKVPKSLASHPVILLACEGRGTPLPKEPWLRKVEKCQTTSAYVIRRDYIPVLQDLWGIPDPRGRRAIDQLWKTVQVKDNWAMADPLLIYQGASYSDIEKKDVNRLTLSQTAKT